MGVAAAVGIGCLACSSPSDQSTVDDTPGGTTVETTGADAPAAPPPISFAHEEIEPAPVGADVKAVGDVDGDGDVDVVAGDDSGFALSRPGLFHVRLACRNGAAAQQAYSDTRARFAEDDWNGPECAQALADVEVKEEYLVQFWPAVTSPS